MERRHFSVTLTSANIPEVRKFGNMKVYAKVSFRDLPSSEYQTPVDVLCGTDLKWNYVFEYWVSQSALQREGPGRMILEIELYFETMLGDHDHVYLQANTNLKKLFEIGISSSAYTAAVKNADGQATEGTVVFSYKFGDLKIFDVNKNEQSFVGAVVKETAVALLAEGVKTVVLAMLS